MLLEVAVDGIVTCNGRGFFDVCLRSEVESEESLLDSSESLYLEMSESLLLVSCVDFLLNFVCCSCSGGGGDRSRCRLGSVGCISWLV